MKCPICSNSEFKSYNQRPNAQCTKCKSLERGRYLWIVLNKMDLLKSGIRVLHIAPEKFLLKPFKSICGKLYHPCDINPNRYKNKTVKIYEFDLCKDIQKFPTDCFDLIIHNHVLEHIPCSVEKTLESLIRIMKPGGYQFFTVPFRDKYTKEDSSFNLSDIEREKQFGQADHLRIFGTQDFPLLLKNIFKTNNFYIRPEEFAEKKDFIEAGISQVVNKKINGTTIFYFRK